MVTAVIIDSPFHEPCPGFLGTHKKWLSHGAQPALTRPLPSPPPIPGLSPIYPYLSQSTPGSPNLYLLFPARLIQLSVCLFGGGGILLNRMSGYWRGCAIFIVHHFAKLSRAKQNSYQFAFNDSSCCLRIWFVHTSIFIVVNKMLVLVHYKSRKLSITPVSSIK